MQHDMSSRTRLHRAAKAGGMAASLWLMFCWALSNIWGWYYQSEVSPANQVSWSVGVVSGQFRSDTFTGTGCRPRVGGFHCYRPGDPSCWRMPRYLCIDLARSQHYVWRILEIPLWLPFIMVALPTGVIWSRDRRRVRPGYCRRCGYDLQGNVSGVCPECGFQCGSKT